MNRRNWAARLFAAVLVTLLAYSPVAAISRSGAELNGSVSGLVHPIKDGEDDDTEPIESAEDGEDDEAEPIESPETEEIEPTEVPDQDGDTLSEPEETEEADDQTEDAGDDQSSDDGAQEDGEPNAESGPGVDEQDDSTIDGTYVPVVDSDGDVATDGFRSGQAVVRLQPGASIDTFVANHGAKLVASIEQHDLYLIELPGEVAIDQAEREISSDPDTRWSELNYVNQAPEGRPGYFFVSGAPGTDGAATYTPALLGYDNAQICQIGEGVVVAVLDSGVDASHPALRGHLLSGWNALNGSGDVRDVGNNIDDDGDGIVDEMVGHGTHVAGIVIQVAPGAAILPVKVLNSDGVGDAFYVAAGIYYAIDHGANVINLSLSSTYDARVVAEAVFEANEGGIVVVAAAGNNSTNRILEFPAADAGVLSIAATDELDRKTDFSNYGELIDLSAPGVDIVSALPGGRYAAWSGTSMAAPFVAGAAALVVGTHPNWTTQQIANRLLQKSEDIDELNPDYAGELGAGRLDVGAAVNCGSS